MNNVGGKEKNMEVKVEGDSIVVDNESSPVDMAKPTTNNNNNNEEEDQDGDLSNNNNNNITKTGRNNERSRITYKQQRRNTISQPDLLYKLRINTNGNGRRLFRIGAVVGLP